jgi:hypothetical protein
LLANSVSDLAANLGPIIAPTIAAVLIDRTAPIGTWSTPVATSYVSPSFELTMPEAITGLTSSDFLMIGAATQCVLSVTETISGVKFTIGTTGCSDGSVQILLNAGAYTDAFGNLGPSIVSASAVTTKVVQPTPTPTPTPTASVPVTAAPMESASPILAPVPDISEPTTSNPVPEAPESQSGANPEGTEIVAAQPLKKTYAFTTPHKELPNSEIAIQQQTQSPSQITVQNPTDPKPISVTGVNWLNIASLGFGGLAAIFGVIGAVKAARQMRTRRLVRKFA